MNHLNFRAPRSRREMNRRVLDRIEYTENPSSEEKAITEIKGTLVISGEVYVSNEANTDPEAARRTVRGVIARQVYGDFPHRIGVTIDLTKRLRQQLSRVQGSEATEANHTVAKIAAALDEINEIVKGR